MQSFLNFKTDGTYNYHYALKGQISVKIEAVSLTLISDHYMLIIPLAFVFTLQIYEGILRGKSNMRTL
jgi:hypothetical protein